MNFLCAVILAVCKGDEDQTLTIFTCLMEDTSFGEYFHRETHFEALQDDTREMTEILEKRDAVLHEHLRNLGFDMSTITPTWLLTCFFLPIGPARAMDVIDELMKTGPGARQCLVELAISTIFDHRQCLLECQDLDEIYQVFKKNRQLV